MRALEDVSVRTWVWRDEGGGGGTSEVGGRGGKCFGGGGGQWERTRNELLDWADKGDGKKCREEGGEGSGGEMCDVGGPCSVKLRRRIEED